MLLSRLDEGRAVPVEPRPGPAGASVAHQLDMLLGEHLLPLRTRRTPDEPHLLAVDASGQPVVVEVVGLLDAEICLRALRHAGEAARMSSQDIADAYRGGPDLFAGHFEAFRSTVLASSQLSTQVRSGARLMLVCTDVDPAIDDVLEFLLQPGWQVEVLCVRVTTDTRGGKVADVVPVERRAPDREPLLPRRPRPVAVPDPDPLPRRHPADHRGERPAPVRPSVVPPSFAVVRGGAAPQSRGVDPDVADLASLMGGPVDLVWQTDDGTTHEVLLHVDGRIELPDGQFVDDVATAAARLHGPVPDARAVWHVGDHYGPTLAELLV